MEDAEKFARIKRYLHELEADLSLGSVTHIYNDSIEPLKQNIREALDVLADVFGFDEDKLLQDFPRVTKLLKETN